MALVLRRNLKHPPPHRGSTIYQYLEFYAHAAYYWRTQKTFLRRFRTAEDHQEAGYIDAGYCIDRPDGMPEDYEKAGRGTSHPVLMYVSWRRHLHRMDDLKSIANHGPRGTLELRDNAGRLVYQGSGQFRVTIGGRMPSPNMPRNPRGNT